MTVDQLGEIRMALDVTGVELEWLLSFLGKQFAKKGLSVTRLEEVPRSYHAKVLAVIRDKANQTT